MRVFFLSEKRCALFFGGVFLGTADGFERSAELDPADRIFCELQAPGCAPESFVFDEAFLFAPPPPFELYFSRGTVTVYCRSFARADPSLTVVRQERVNGALFTLCMQGRLQLNMENETGFHILPLPERFMNCTFRACGEDFLLEGSGTFALIKRDGTVRIRAEGRVLECGETLVAEIAFRDSGGHTAIAEWRDGELLRYTVRTAREPTETTFALALFESVLIGADCTPFLADALKPKAGALRAYLGDFSDVALTARQDVVGLVYPRKERVFDVRYFRVTLEDGKIANISEAP